MQPLSLTQLLDYLAGLAGRHMDVRTAVVGLPGAFPALSFATCPAVLIEADPLCEQVNEGADSYSVAIQFLAKDARDEEGRYPALASAMKQLADEVGQQLLREGVVQLNPARPPACVPLHGTGDSLASGVRWEVSLLVPKVLNRTTNPTKFQPYQP